MNREEFNTSLSDMTKDVFESNPEIKENILKELNNIENPSIPTILDAFAKQEGVRPEVLLDTESDVHKAIFKSDKQFEKFQKGLERYQDFEQNYNKFEPQGIKHERKFDLNEENSLMQISPLSLSQVKGAKVAYDSNEIILGNPFGAVAEDEYSIAAIDKKQKDVLKEQLGLMDKQEQEMEESNKFSLEDYLRQELEKIESTYEKRKNKYFERYLDGEGNEKFKESFTIVSGGGKIFKDVKSIQLADKPTPHDIVMTFSKLDEKHHNIASWEGDKENVEALKEGLEKAMELGVLDINDLTCSKGVPKSVKNMIQGLKERNTIGYTAEDPELPGQKQEETPSFEASQEEPSNKEELTEDGRDLSVANQETERAESELAEELAAEAQEPTVNKEEQKARNTNRNKRSNK